MPISGFESIQELINWTPPYQASIIEEGILKAGTGMIIFGDAKGWKSMLALYTADCIASGAPWFGYKTTKAVAAKYQCELPKAIDRERTIKYFNSHRPAVFLKTNPYISLDTAYGKSSIDHDLEEMTRALPHQHIVLILDPIYLMISGNVSDPTDVKKFVTSINDLKSKHNISVILIHHTHKTRVDSSGNVVDLGSDEIMGSYYWKAWADTMVRVRLLNENTGSDRVRVSFELVRHATRPLEAFSIKWSRQDLHPTIYHKEAIEDDSVSVRGLV